MERKTFTFRKKDTATYHVCKQSRISTHSPPWAIFLTSTREKKDVCHSRANIYVHNPHNEILLLFRMFLGVTTYVLFTKEIPARAEVYHLQFNRHFDSIPFALQRYSRSIPLLDESAKKHVIPRIFILQHEASLPNLQRKRFFLFVRQFVNNRRWNSLTRLIS